MKRQEPHSLLGLIAGQEALKIRLARLYLSSTHP